MIKKNFDDIYNELITVCIENNIDYEIHKDDIKKLTTHYHTYQNLFVDALENQFCFDYKEIEQPITGNKINRIFTPSGNLLAFSFMSLRSFDAFTNKTIPEGELILFITALADYDEKNESYYFLEAAPNKVTINDNKRQNYQNDIMIAFSNHILKDLKNTVINNSQKIKKLCESMQLIDSVINIVYSSGYDLEALFKKDHMYTPKLIVDILDEHSELIFIATDINIDYQLNKLKVHYHLDNKHIFSNLINIADSFIKIKSDSKEKKQTILSKFFNKFK